MITEQTIPIPKTELAPSDAAVIAKGALVNFLGTMAKILKSISFIILTRLFGPEIFGLYGLAWSIIDLTSKVGHFALDKSIIHFLPRYHGDGDTNAIYVLLSRAFGVGLIMGFLTGIGAFLSAPLLEAQFQKTGMATMLQILAPVLPLMSLTMIILGVTRAHKIMKYDAYIKSIAEPLIMFGMACVLYYMGWHVAGIAAGHAVALVGSVIFAGFVFSKFYSWRQCFQSLKDFRLWSPMTRFSLPVMGYEVMYLMMIRLDILMVGYFLSAMEVGIYLIATEIALSTKKVRQWFDPIFSPIVSELAYRQGTQRIGHNFAMVTRWILTINIAFLCGVFLIGEELLGLFGPEFGIGFLTMIILAVSHVVYSSMGSGDTILIMSGHPYINLVNTVIVVAVNFGLNVVLIPKFGMVGAAVGTLASFSLLTLIRGIEVYRLFRIHPFRWILIKPILSATVSFAIAYTTSFRLPDYDVLRMVVPPLLFMGCYGLGLWRMKLEDEDYLVLERLFARLRRKNAKKNAWRLSV